MQVDKATATDFFRWSHYPVIIDLGKPAVPYRAALVETCGRITQLARKIGDDDLLRRYRNIFVAFCNATAQIQAARVVGDQAFWSGKDNDLETSLATPSTASKPKVKSARTAEVVSLCELCIKAGPLFSEYGEENLLDMVCALCNESVFVICVNDLYMCACGGDGSGLCLILLMCHISNKK